MSAFFEEVASQTGVGVQLQHLLYLGHDLPLEGSMKVVNLPSTSPARPLILLSYGLEANNSLPFRERKAIKDAHTFDVFLWSLFFILCCRLPEDMKEVWYEVYPSVTPARRTRKYLCESAVLWRFCWVILIWLLIPDIQRWVHNNGWLKRKVIHCCTLLCSRDSSHPIQVWCNGRLQLLQGTAELIFYPSHA